MMNLRLVASIGFLLAACTGTRPPLLALAEAERMRTSASGEEAKRLVPAAFAAAEQIRGDAIAAEGRGDTLLASILAERASAAYAKAFALVRAMRARDELGQARAEGDRAEREFAELSRGRATLSTEAETLEAKLSLLEERLRPAPLGRADGKREAARLVAARSMSMQARLLCAAARSVAPQAEEPKSAEAAVTALSTAVQQGRANVLDEAETLRGKCLTALTMARRSSTAGEAGMVDLLFADLSSRGGFELSRDERGVIVAMRDLFDRHNTLLPAGKSKLSDLAKALSSRPGFGIQIVVHTERPVPKDGEAKFGPWTAAIADALGTTVDGTRVVAVVAGSQLPLVDPADARGRSRNERIEIVLVSPRLL